jgi:hypothetical protein
MVSAKRPFILPYEPEYATHRTVRRQRRNARLLMHLHMNALHESPSIAPELPNPDDDRVLPAATPRSGRSA